MRYDELPKLPTIAQAGLSTALMYVTAELLPVGAIGRLHDPVVLDAVLGWVMGCNLLAFIAVAILHKLRSYSITWKDWIEGLVCFFIPPLVAIQLPGPFRLIATQISFWLFQPFGWHLWAGSMRPAHRISDIAHEWSRSKQVVPYDPTQYFDFQRGIFVGLAEDSTPQYLTFEQARMHAACLGMTRCGKNSVLSLMLSQLAIRGESVVCLLPKNDSHMPGVLKAIADRYGKKFVFLDLNEPIPQLNPFRDCSPREIETMQIQTFRLYLTVDNSAVYRAEELTQCRLVSRLSFRSLPHLFSQASKIETVVKARRYFESLKELCELPAVQTTEGINLNEVIAEPDTIVVIIGSVEHDPTIRLQQLLIQKLVMVIQKKAHLGNQTWTTLFLDEFKYCMCRAAITALSTIADKNATIHLACQSLGDLEGDSENSGLAVAGPVMDNTGLKLLFRTNHQATAEWIEKLCGTVPTHSETVPINASTERMDQGSFREAPGPIFHSNVVKSLPPLRAILYGVGVPKLISVGFLPCGPRPQPLAAPPDIIEESEVI